MEVKRGNVYYANLNKVIGCEQGGIRPVVIVQNDIGNQCSQTTIIIPITSRKIKKFMPTQVKSDSDIFKRESTVLTEQIRTIDKSRLGGFIGKLSQKDMLKIEKAIGISLGLNYFG